MLRSFV